jgi:hypothetical protein
MRMATHITTQCFGCGSVGEGEVDDADGNYYCFACWLVYHAARARLGRARAHMQSERNVQGVSCTPEVRNMSEAFREYLLHLDDSRSCSGPALTSDAATSRMYLLHLDSMRNESA